jgi:Holliday junction resolvase
MSNYEVGRRLEYRVRDIFRKQGFLVIRAAQSKPIDLVCMKEGQSMLIECKAGRSFLGQDRKKELLALSEQAGAVMVLARRRKRHVELTKLSDGQPLEFSSC